MYDIKPFKEFKVKGFEMKKAVKVTKKVTKVYKKAKKK
jgi:hypothetical protein